MKKQKIKPLPVVKAFALYLLRRARRVLKLKQSEYDGFHIDFHDPESVDVWFFCNTDIIGHVAFTSDGRVKDKKDIIDKRKK